MAKFNQFFHYHFFSLVLFPLSLVAFLSPFPSPMSPDSHFKASMSTLVIYCLEMVLQA